MGVKRIGLFGNFGGGNLGNEGSLAAMLLFLRETYPQAELVAICVDPAAVSAEHGIPARPISAPRIPGGGILAKVRARVSDHVYLFRNMRKLDVLLVPGTGVLDDFAERPLGFPYTLFLASFIARARGIPMAFVSIGAGPIRHPLSRWFMKTAARLAVYRSYRDTLSRDFMASIGANVSADRVYPDLAFRLPDPPQVERQAGGALTIGLGVMAYYGWSGDAGENMAIYDRYTEKLATFAIWLLQAGHTIRILIGEECDLRAVDDLTDSIARAASAIPEAHTIPEGRVIFEAPRSLGDLMAQIASVDAVVATRFHNVLCALKVGKPTISLGYARKNDVLMEAMGLGAFCQHVERFDVEELKRQFGILIDERATYGDIVRHNGANLRQQLEQQEKHLAANVI